MHYLLPLLWAWAAAASATPGPAVSETEFRAASGLGSEVSIQYRDLSCQPIDYAQFAAAMSEEGMTAETVRAPDGRAAAVSLHRRGGPSCGSPFGPITQMPPLDLPDLAGKRVTAQSLRGKPTLINFYFAACKPCILEVEPLNRFAAARPDLRVLAVTFDDPATARAFVDRFKFRWRVVPDAKDFIDRMAVTRYPLMALFDAQGRLLGTRAGGAKDALEAAAVEPGLRRWVDGLLRTAGP